jgi:hypothetical protein
VTHSHRVSLGSLRGLFLTVNVISSDFTDMFTLYCHNLQVEAYRDMIMPVVDAFKYLTQV